MSTTFISLDRSALKEWEAASKYAEECRQDFVRSMTGPFSPGWTPQAAMTYAEAANKAAEARERYEALVMTMLEEERAALPTLEELSV